MTTILANLEVLKMKTAAAIVITMLGAIPMFGWSPAACNPPIMAKRAELQKRVRSARPGTGLYTPKPYPATDAEVIADFEGYVTRVYGRPDSRPDRFSALADGVMKNRYSYEVLRVDDWTPARCAESDGGADTYFLLVLKVKSTGAEAARATVHESGLAGTIAIPFPKLTPDSITAVADTLASNLAHHGTHIGRAQFVRTWGTLECDTTRPCAAARDASGQIYIARGHAVFIVDERPLFSWRRDLKTPAQKQSLTTSLGQSRWVSVGGDSVMVARPVE